MTKLQARAVLDAVRSGADVADALIDAALVALGDLGEDDVPLYRVRRPVGTWEGQDTPQRRAGPFDGLMR